MAACETTDVCKTEQPVVPPLPVIGLFQRLRGKSRGLLLPLEASSLQSVSERRRLRGVSLRSQPPPSPLPRLVGTRRGAKKRKWVDGKAVVYMRGTSGALCGRPGCLYLIVLLSHRWDLVSPFKFCDKKGRKNCFTKLSEPTGTKTQTTDCSHLQVFTETQRTSDQVFSHRLRVQQGSQNR